MVDLEKIAGKRLNSSLWLLLGVLLLTLSGLLHPFFHHSDCCVWRYKTELQAFGRGKTELVGCPAVAAIPDQKGTCPVCSGNFQAADPVCDDFDCVFFFEKSTVCGREVRLPSERILPAAARSPPIFRGMKFC